MFIRNRLLDIVIILGHRRYRKFCEVPWSQFNGPCDPGERDRGLYKDAMPSSGHQFLAASFAFIAILIALVAGASAAPAGASRQPRAAMVGANVTAILLALAASKPPSSPWTTRQTTVELSPFLVPRLRAWAAKS